MFVAQKDDDGWGRLKPVEFLKGARPPFDRLQQKDADVYYGAVNANPALQGTLLGLFPAASRDRAAIMMPSPATGSIFPRRSKFWRSAHDRGEVVDHAVDGVSVDDGDAFIYIHAGVPGTLWRTCEFSTMKPPPSELDSIDLAAGEAPRCVLAGGRDGAAAGGAM